MMKHLRCVGLLVVVSNLALLAQSNPLPLVYQPLGPASVRPGHRAFTLTVHGTHFVKGAVVQWNGSPRKTTFVSRKKVMAAIGAADVAKAATASITVANPHANGGHSNTVYLPVRLPATTVAMRTDSALTTAGGVTAGDFNSDGNLDVLVATGAPRTVESFLGMGNGTFSHLVGATSQFFPTIGAFAADFNGDGRLDIALTMDDGFTEGQVLLGMGDGTFTSSGVGGAFGGEAIGAGDFHGNGRLDLVFSSVSRFGGTSYFIYAGNGDGTFGTAGILGVSGLVHGNPAIGDFNGDGKLDLAFADFSYPSNIISVFFGNGDGTFQAPVSTPIPQAIASVVAADVNGDGNLDLIADGSCVFFGKGNGTFTQGSCNALPAGLYVRYFDLADFNGDGKLDVVTLGGFENVSPFRQVVTIALGNGDGTFQKPLQFHAGVTATSFRGLGIGDFNNDGKLDVVAHSQNRTFLFLQK
jgi:hypothetical protein